MNQNYQPTFTEDERRQLMPVILDAMERATSAMPERIREQMSAEIAEERACLPVRDPHLSDAERRLAQLDRERTAIKAFYDEWREAIEAVVAERGVGHMFQDEEGIVYRLDVAEGRYVHYERFEVNRTKRAGERAGSLSVKSAVEAGFEVPKV